MVARRALLVLAGAALVLAACGPAADDGTSGAATTGAEEREEGEDREEPADGDDEPEGHTGGVALPDPDDLPPTDFDRHEVPLEDIHFNTFDGGSLPLSEATEDDIEGLRDRIPPIERPRYVPGDTVELDGDDLVLGYVTDAGQAYAYPVRILNFHEIVNDELGGTPVLVSYCPLCRSGVVYDRRLDGRELTFGNTSALFDNDLVMYDHQTNSYWWQIAGRGLVGDLSGEELTPLPSSMALWEDWQQRYPDTLVLSADTGFARPYDQPDPFAGYREQVDQGLRPFPDAEASRSDDRLDDGEEVLGVVLDGEARAYPLRSLGDAVLNDELAGTPLLVVSREDGPSGMVFEREVDGRVLTFAEEDGELRDEQTGSTWGLDGRATDGPLAGEELIRVPTRSSFWFAFVAAFPDTDVGGVDDA